MNHTQGAADLKKDHGHMGLAEIAARIERSKERVRQLSKEAPDFPQPCAELAMGSVWHSDDIEAWIERHPTRPAGVHIASRRRDATP